MAEKATGITSSNPNAWVATFEASEEAEGHGRLVQIVSLTSGKIDQSVGAPNRTVSTNDSLTITTVSGNILVGDNSFLSIYVEHSQPAGKCLVTPLLCDNDGIVIGSLPSKMSSVGLTLTNATGYLSSCLTWSILSTGSWKIYSHVCELSNSNEVKLWVFTF